MNNVQTPAAPSFLRRHQISLFFVLAFALSWLVWGSAIAHAHGVLSFQLPDLLAYFGVSLAGFIVTGLVDGWTGVRALLRRMIRWRVGWTWYGVVLLLPVALPLLTIFVYGLLGGRVQMGSVLPLPAAAIYFAIGVPFMLLTEEAA